MKYYNKEFFELSKNHYFVDNFDIIPDKKYTKQDIEKLYNKRLKLEMEDEKKEYNTKPDFSAQEEEIKSEDIDFTDYIYTDEETGKMHIPTSKKEILKNLEKEKKKALKAFNERPPFDEKAFELEFKENYEFMLEETVEENLPKWVLEKVDNRIIALNYMPKSIFEKIKNEQVEAQRKLNQIREEASKVLEAQNIPSKIADSFNEFYDSRIRAFKAVKNDYQMRLVTEDDELVVITFKNAKILENEKMDFRKDAVFYVGEELYSKSNGYEVHIMASSYTKKGNELKYITLECSDIKISIEE